MKPTKLALVSLLLFSCRTIPPVDQPLIYLDSLITSLGLADENHMPVSQVEPSSWETFIDRTKSYEWRATSFQQAATMLDLYRTSQRESIRQSATACTDIYTGLANLDRAVVEEARKFKENQTPWDFQTFMPKNTELRQTLWNRFEPECIDPALSPFPVDSSLNPPHARINGPQNILNKLMGLSTQMTGDKTSPPVLAAARIAKLISGADPAWFANFSAPADAASASSGQSIESYFQEAMRFNNAGKKDLAVMSYAKAESQIESIVDPVKKEMLLEQLCGYLVGSGFSTDGLPIVRRLTNETRKAQFLQSIGQNLVGKDNAQAQSMYQEAANSARFIVDVKQKDSMLSEVAYFQTMHNWKDDANNTASQITDAALHDRAMKALQ